MQIKKRGDRQLLIGCFTNRKAEKLYKIIKFKNMRFKPIFFLLIFFSNSLYSQSRNGTSSSIHVFLYMISQKLNQVKNIKFHQQLLLNYPSENYHAQVNWSVYYDFEGTDTLTGFKYQIDNPSRTQIFNGTEVFDLNKKDKTIEINDHPDKKVFSNLTAFVNSFNTIRNSIPLISKDQSIRKALTDTLINNESYYLLTLDLGSRTIKRSGRRLDQIGGFDTMRIKRNSIYKIIFSKKNDLPFIVLQLLPTPGSSIKTTFTDMEINITAPNSPPEPSWYYSSYLKEYTPTVKKAIPRLAAVGSTAPEWELVEYNTNKPISLKGFIGKIVLIDFWIKNCGPCIQSVAYLNKLYEKFKGKDFGLVSINAYDSKENVSWFCNKHNIKYPVLLKGRNVTEQYGVSGYPTIFILDRDGKIIYSQAGFDESKTEQVLENALQ